MAKLLLPPERGMLGITSEIGLPHQPETGLSAGVARAIRAINDGLNEGICVSPRKPLKDMTTRDALIEDMPPPSGQVSGARERLAKRSEEELKERHARLKLREDWATRELAEIPAERIDERRKRVAEDESPRPKDRRARTDDAADCLLTEIT